MSPLHSANEQLSPVRDLLVYYQCVIETFTANLPNCISNLSTSPKLYSIRHARLRVRVQQGWRVLFRSVCMNRQLPTSALYLTVLSLLVASASSLRWAFSMPPSPQYLPPDQPPLCREPPGQLSIDVEPDSASPMSRRFRSGDSPRPRVATRVVIWLVPVSRLWSQFAPVSG